MDFGRYRVEAGIDATWFPDARKTKSEYLRKVKN
jgi:hypothetical protein